MPTNLNALIRYKQIDKCLRNRFVDCTIQRMQELCSEALGEFRGIYKTVSERTIREDLRVMRSEILDFNAPIEFKDGVYYYSDPEFSIFQTPVSEIRLLQDIYELLTSMRSSLPEKEVEKMLERIQPFIEKETEPEKISYSLSMEPPKETEEKKSGFFSKKSRNLRITIKNSVRRDSGDSIDENIIQSFLNSEPEKELTLDDVLKLLLAG